MSRLKKKLELKDLKASTYQTHIRRCHKCDGITECDDHDVKACAVCGKPMAPFYFFSDVEVVPYTDTSLRPDRTEGKVKPIVGFTAYW